MLRNILVFLGIVKGEESVRVVKVEGDQTPPAKGRAKRLKAERQRKDRLTRIGNKDSNGLV